MRKKLFIYEIHGKHKPPYKIPDEKHPSGPFFLIVALAYLPDLILWSECPSCEMPLSISPGEYKVSLFQTLDVEVGKVSPTLPFPLSQTPWFLHLKDFALTPKRNGHGLNKTHSKKRK